MKYIGLHCHKQYDQATMIDTETGEIKAKRLAHIKEDFSDFIGDRDGTRMVIEGIQRGSPLNWWILGVAITLSLWSVALGSRLAKSELTDWR